jgi:hypothetical protein
LEQAKALHEPIYDNRSTDNAHECDQAMSRHYGCREANLDQLLSEEWPVQPSGGGFKTMKKLLALVMLVFAFAASPAMAQNVEFDIYDKADFDKQLASNKPVIVHVNTTW